MPYTPPGVQTTVVINQTTVTLPGGTRILSLIGNANRTVAVAGEAQLQTNSRNVQVNNSGLSTISRVYDYSGPGNSLYTYPSSGNGAYGSGYYSSPSVNSGNSILWTPAANSYPSSTTPSIGSTFYVTYNYSGVAHNESEITPVISSGVGNALAISVSGGNVTGVISVSGSGYSINFPTNIANPSGAGYYLSGNTLLWSQGTYASFAIAQADGFVPSGQSTIFVNYHYSGVSVGEAQVQNSLYSEQLNVGNVLSIVSVSGSSSAYPASGTITTQDTSGYGTSGSGYYQSGNYVNWNAVNPAAYAYPPSTVPYISGVTTFTSNDQFYVDYTYTKTVADYAPAAYVALTDVVAEFGNIATWNLITTGANAGSYTLAAINPITLGSYVAFQNNASVLMLVQNQGAGLTGGDFLNSLNQLQTKTVDVIVPITVGSGNTQNAMGLTDISLALNYTNLHCQTMSNSINMRERVSLGSLGVAEIGDVNTPNTYIYTASVALDSSRIALVAPGTATIQLQDPSGAFQNVQIDGSFLAVAVGALSCSPLNDVATPLTNQELNGFAAISAQTPKHPSTDYLAVEMNNLAAAGCMVIAAEGPRIFVRQQLTTNQANVVVGEFSVVTLVDYVSQAVRAACTQFIGQKLKPTTTVPAVKGAILSALQALAQADIISSIGGITVTIDPTNPTQLLVQAAYTPIFPLNRIFVNFTINTLG